MECKYCSNCGSELEKHEIKFEINDCGLEKTWYQDGKYCRKCDEVFVEYD
jgi:predicted RNA-binding Zn-ribbon protein involved in translation (DUF1610 family)